MSEFGRPVKPSSISRLGLEVALYEEAVADRLALNPTDLRCLELSLSDPGLSATRLAELSGLSSGAVTGVLDRLESAGLIQREADATDRRRTLVRPRPERITDVSAVRRPLERAIEALDGTIDARTRSAIESFLGQVTEAYRTAAAQLRADVRGGMVGEMFSAPLRDAQVGRLSFASGAPRLALRAAPLGPTAEARMVAELAHSRLELTTDVGADRLCRATFGGAIPEVKTRDGSVRVRYKRRIDWRPRDARIALSPEVIWDVDISGGLSEMKADLRGLRLGRFDLRGGVDALHLRLPAPRGRVRVRASGSSADVELSLLPGTAARMRISGGAQRIAFGDQRMRQVHGELRLETRDAGEATDRYEIELKGGFRDVTVAIG
jgi:DNA-binding MarR family transcriptional regulator